MSNRPAFGLHQTPQAQWEVRRLLCCLFNPHCRKGTPAESRAVSQRGLRLRAKKWKATRLLQLFKMTLRWWGSKQLKGAALLRGDMQSEGVSHIRGNFPQMLRFLLNVPLFSTIINNNNFSYLSLWNFCVVSETGHKNNSRWGQQVIPSQIFGLSFKAHHSAPSRSFWEVAIASCCMSISEPPHPQLSCRNAWS